MLCQQRLSNPLINSFIFTRSRPTYSYTTESNHSEPTNLLIYAGNQPTVTHKLGSMLSSNQFWSVRGGFIARCKMFAEQSGQFIAHDTSNACSTVSLQTYLFGIVCAKTSWPLFVNHQILDFFQNILYRKLLNDWLLKEAYAQKAIRSKMSSSLKQINEQMKDIATVYYITIFILII